MLVSKQYLKHSNAVVLVEMICRPISTELELQPYLDLLAESILNMFCNKSRQECVCHCSQWYRCSKKVAIPWYLFRRWSIVSFLFLEIHLVYRS